MTNILLFDEDLDGVPDLVDIANRLARPTPDSNLWELQAEALEELECDALISSDAPADTPLPVGPDSQIHCVACGAVFTDRKSWKTWPNPFYLWILPTCPECGGGWFTDGDRTPWQRILVRPAPPAPLAPSRIRIRRRRDATPTPDVPFGEMPDAPDPAYAEREHWYSCSLCKRPLWGSDWFCHKCAYFLRIVGTPYRHWPRRVKDLVNIEKQRRRSLEKTHEGVIKVRREPFWEQPGFQRRAPYRQAAEVLEYHRARPGEPVATPRPVATPCAHPTWARERAKHDARHALSHARQCAELKRAGSLAQVVRGSPILEDPDHAAGVLVDPPKCADWGKPTVRVLSRAELDRAYREAHGIKKGKLTVHYRTMSLEALEERLDENDPDMGPGDWADMETIQQPEDAIDDLRFAMDSLPEDLADVLVRLHVDGYTQEEAGAALAEPVSQSTVSRRAAKAYDLLRNWLLEDA